VNASNFEFPPLCLEIPTRCQKYSKKPKIQTLEAPKIQKNKLWKTGSRPLVPSKTHNPNFGFLFFWCFCFFVGFGFLDFCFLVFWTNLLSEERMSKANPKIQKSKNPTNQKTKNQNLKYSKKPKKTKLWRTHLFTLSGGWGVGRTVTDKALANLNM